MSSKSKRKHAKREYNRANTGLSAEQVAEQKAAETEAADAINTDSTQVGSGAPMVLTQKDLRMREIEKQKQAKLEKKLAKKAAKNDPKKKEKKEKKDKRNIFVEMGSELKKVHWPTWPEAWKATGVVLGVTVVFGLVVLGLDRLLGWLYEMLIGGN